MSMSQDMLNLLNYLYNDFAVSFVICLCGSMIRNMLNSYKNNTKINIKKIIIYGAFSTILLCAVRAYIDIEFNIYIFICILAGMWSDSIINFFTNSKIMLFLLNRLLKNINEPISKVVSDVSNEIKKEETHEDK